MCSLEAILLAELMIQLVLSPRRAPPQQSWSPRGWYSPVPWRGLRRAPVSRTCHTYTNRRALPAGCCCYGVVAVLRLVLVLLLLHLPIALSSLLITCNEKMKEKTNVTKSKESKEFREGSFPQQLIFSSAITGWQGLRGGTICQACPPRWARSNYDVCQVQWSCGVAVHIMNGEKVLN